MTMRAPVILVAAWLLVLAGCDKGGAPPRTAGSSGPHTMLVAVSILPQKYFVERLAGPRAEVMALLPPGSNPATYDPSMSTLARLSRAKLWVRVGVPGFVFERAWTEKIRSAAPHMRLVDSSKGVPLIGHNPHVWLSPRLVVTQARNIAEALMEVDPEGREFYRERLEVFEKELRDLDAELGAAMSKVEGKTFVVFHPAWEYFARDYGIHLMVIEEQGREPGPDKLAKMVDQARAKGIRTVFVQPQISSRSAQTVAEALGGKVVAIDPLAEDWPGALRDAALAFVEAAR